MEGLRASASACGGRGRGAELAAPARDVVQGHRPGVGCGRSCVGCFYCPFGDFGYPTGGPVTARAGMGAVPSAGAREGLVGRQGGCKGSERSKSGAHREGGGEVVDGFEGERRGFARSTISGHRRGPTRSLKSEMEGAILTIFFQSHARAHTQIRGVRRSGRSKSGIPRRAHHATVILTPSGAVVFYGCRRRGPRKDGRKTEITFAPT